MTDRHWHEALTEALAAVAMTCVDGDPRTLKRSEIVEVTGFDITAAARCQAGAAAPPEPFQADLFTTTKTLALRSIPGLRRTGSALDSVSRVMREAQRSDDGAADDDWLRRFLKESPIDVRARVAARAAGWLTRTLEILEVSDLQETRAWRTGIPLQWDYPGRGLRLRTKIDLLIPDPEHPGVLLPIVVASSGRVGLADELGFLHLLWKSTRRPVPNPGDQTQPTPTRRQARSASAIDLSQAIVVDHRQADLQRRSLDSLAEQGLAATVRAATAVTERDRISAMAIKPPDATPHADGPQDAPTGQWPHPVLKAWFPNYLDQQASRFTCERCLWNTVCDTAATLNAPSPIVSNNSGNRHHLAGPAHTPDQGETATQSITEQAEAGGDMSVDESPMIAPHWALVGGIRLSEPAGQ